MNGLGFPLLSLVLWLPTLGALILLAVPSAQAARQIALAVSLLTFLVSLPLIFSFDRVSTALQFSEQVSWVQNWGISYHLGLDGISLWLVILTTFLVPITVYSTWDSVHERVRSFQVCMLLLETAMLGVFLAQDLFLFYIFWEFSLIPMALLIGIWGGPRRVYAALKFFLYTFAGSLLMLLGIIALYLLHGGNTFSMPEIAADLRSGAFVLDTTTARLLFGAFFVAFAVKVPIWPLHTWLPTAHVEAPTAGSVILAGVLLKLGAYGLIRFNLTLFPQASQFFAPAVALLAMIGILYGAAVSFGQTDIKKIVAYSSVSHLGFVVLGIFALNNMGVQGALIQSVNHGLSTGALFLVVGMIYERRHTRELNAFGGLWKVMPIYTTLSLIIVLSSIGLPGLNGFIGEFTILQGAFASPYLGWQFVLPSVFGVVLAATYLLRMFRGAYMGEVSNAENANLKDASLRELIVLGALLVPIVVLGLFPNLIFAPMEPSVTAVLEGIVPAVAGK